MGTLTKPWQEFQRLVAGARLTALGDRELLAQYVSNRDGEAFTVIVERHGRMVLNLCRRIIGDPQLCEDAFQAVFLVLARKAGSLACPDSLAAWLYGTARRIALQVRKSLRNTSNQSLDERASSQVDPLIEISGRELILIIEEEIAKLPDSYRLPLILCSLDGQSILEAAHSLNSTPGSIRNRLSRARQRLSQRLTRRGLKISTALMVLLSVPRMSVALPLLTKTVQLSIQKEAIPTAIDSLASSGIVTVSKTGLTSLALVMTALIALGAIMVEQSSSTKSEEKKQIEAEKPKKVEDLPQGAIARLGWNPLRVGNAQIALTPDGNKVVALSEGAIIHIFDASSGKLLERKLLGNRRDLAPETWYYSLSANGSVAAAIENTREGGRLTSWDVMTGQQLKQFLPGVSVNRHILSPDGQLLATGEYVPKLGQEMVRVYDLKTGKSSDIAPLDPNLYQLRFTPDGKRILGTDVNGEEIYCYDVAGRKRAWKSSPGGAEFCFTEDSKVVFCGKQNGKKPLLAIDVETGQAIEEFKLPKYDLSGLPTCSGNRLLLLPLPIGEVAVWDYRLGKELRRLRASKRDFFSVRVIASADGKTALTNGDGLSRWNLETGEQIFGPKGDLNHFGVIGSIAYLSDSKVLSTTTGGDLVRWDISRGEPNGQGIRNAGLDVWVTSQGARTTKVDWSQLSILEAGKSIGKVAFPNDRTPRGPEMFWRYTLLPDGCTAVTYFPQKDKATVRVTDYITGKTLSQAEMQPPNFQAYFQAFSPCGRWFAAKGEVLAVSSGKQLWTPSVNDGWELSKQFHSKFSPDSRLLGGKVVPKSSTTKEDFHDHYAIWEVASGTPIARLSAKNIGRIAFSPDNRTLAYVTGYGVHLIDLETGKLVAEYEDPGINCAHYLTGEANTLVFSPDGRSVATGHYDGSILVWKVPELSTTKLIQAEAKNAWSNLADPDVKNARRAMENLARNPEIAMALLREQFQAPSPPKEVDIPKRIQELDSPTFAIRERSSRQLRELGFQAEPALKEALKTATPEVKQRIEQLLDELDITRRIPLTGETLRGVRAIEVLERIGTPEAKKLIQSWADHSVNPNLVSEAKVALNRMRIKELNPDRK